MAGQKVKQAKSRLKMLNRLGLNKNSTRSAESSNIAQLEKSQQNMTFTMKAIKRSGNDIYRLKNLTIGYKEKTIPTSPLSSERGGLSELAEKGRGRVNYKSKRQSRDPNPSPLPERVGVDSSSLREEDGVG
jgi:ATPase subunit of ABC transporter with duplicated ATPase domains